MEVLDGKALAKEIRENLKEEVESLKKHGVLPKLAVIMVGQDSSSKIYVRNKSKVCQEIGVDFEEYLLDETIQMEELLNLINSLNHKKDVHGILLQSPIPNHLDINEAFKAITPEKDVDGFHPINVGKLCLGQESFVSCTPAGIIQLLEKYHVPMQGKHVVILGRSNIVGKPLIQLVLSKNATVTVCHSKTEEIEKYTKQADILMVAIGKSKFITKDMVKPGAVVIDVGINRGEDRKINRRCRLCKRFRNCKLYNTSTRWNRTHDDCYANEKCCKSSNKKYIIINILGAKKSKEVLLRRNHGKTMLLDLALKNRKY